MTLGEGADEMIVNGKPQVISARAKYQGFCENGVLQIFAEEGKRFMRLRLYFNDKGQLVQEYAGDENQVTVWNKI
ncbi:hypothetical protein D3C87_1900980 [compost metagenome]